ncbi:MAG: alpha-L-rhamnosidase, partial [Clostridiales bacterium]|nr:alpha-L-rhamnosidase [Clostridiales bacterium]
NNLVRLIENNDYCIATGIPGTPFILFALSDNGRDDVAYKMLCNEKCPSWLYEVKVGATTVWERWDGLNEDGVCDMADDGIAGGMVSYNHYVFGSVGAFLYRRVLGVEPTGAGYSKFRVKPVIGGGLTYAKGSVVTPYGEIKASWELNDGKFDLNITVPFGTQCNAVLPDGNEMLLCSGEHRLSCGL